MPVRESFRVSCVQRTFRGRSVLRPCTSGLFGESLFWKTRRVAIFIERQTPRRISFFRRHSLSRRAAWKKRENPRMFEVAFVRSNDFEHSGRKNYRCAPVRLPSCELVDLCDILKHGTQTELLPQTKSRFSPTRRHSLPEGSDWCSTTVAIFLCKRSRLDV